MHFVVLIYLNLSLNSKRRSPIQLKYQSIGITLFLFLSISNLSADVTIRATMPELGPGMARLEALLAESLGPSIAEVEGTFNDLLDKPLLTGGFSSASELNGTLPFQGSLIRASEYSFAFGNYGTLYSDTLDPDRLEDQFSDMEEDDDFNFGMNLLLINTSFTIPLEQLIPRTTGFFSLAYADLSSDEYYLKNFFVQAALGYPILKKVSRRKLLVWHPLYGQGGLSYGFSRIGALVDAGTITDSFELDPDGSGPLLPQDVSIQIEPSGTVGLETHVGTLSFSLSTAISLLETFHYYLGAGVSFALGRTDISVESSEEIIVLGYLADLIEEQGSVSVQGDVKGSRAKTPLTYFFTGIQLDISSLFLTIPFSYSPGSGVSTGLSVGISL